MLEREPTSRRRFLAASGAATLAGFPWVITPAKAVASPKPDAEGYVPLFDGRTLNGWHKNPGRIAHGTGGRWVVEDGVLGGEQDPPGSGNGGILMSDRKFGDFELRLDMNPDWGPDSGVFFRTNSKGHGWQMYVDYYNGGNIGHLRGEMRGSFAMKPFRIFGKNGGDGEPADFTTRPDPRTEKWPEGTYAYLCEPWQWVDAWRPGDWNTAQIRCVGKYPRITTWLNGVKLCEFDGAKSTHPGYGRERVFKQLGRSGSIGLQLHGGTKRWPKGAKVYWKDIRIKPL